MRTREWFVLISSKWLVGALAPLAIGTLILVAGCNPSAQTSTSTSTSNTRKDSGVVASSERDDSSTSATAAKVEADSEHGHKAGAHGGIMVSLGRDSYHVEAVVDTEGSIRLYTLGKDETRVIDIERQSLKGFVKADGDTDSKSITFDPLPQEGDAKDRTSLFVGKLPADLVGRKLDVTIPNIRIAGERFRLGFQSGQESHGESAAMPDKLADAAEKDLYLVPAGRYTAADIEANGNVTASVKFKGIKSAHDMNPKQGDRICPITETKANPNFTWVVDGKSYEFCCPPCVDEFVKTAKASTDPLPEPETYVKK
jgi:hypothetical protein